MSIDSPRPPDQPTPEHEGPSIPNAYQQFDLTEAAVDASLAEIRALDQFEDAQIPDVGFQATPEKTDLGDAVIADDAESIRQDGDPDLAGAPEPAEGSDTTDKGDRPEQPDDAAASAQAQARDLERVRVEIHRIISDLGSLGEQSREALSEFAPDILEFEQQVDVAWRELKQSRPVQGGQIAAMAARAGLAAGSAQAVADDAEEEDGELMKFLRKAFTRLGISERRLMSMNLHTYTPKEWSLNLQGNIFVAGMGVSVTFSK